MAPVTICLIDVIIDYYYTSILVAIRYFLSFCLAPPLTRANKLLIALLKSMFLFGYNTKFVKNCALTFFTFVNIVIFLSIRKFLRVRIVTCLQINKMDPLINKNTIVIQVESFTENKRCKKTD